MRIASLIISGLFLSLATYAQDKFIVDKARLSFTSKASLELIKASSVDVKGIIDAEANQFAFTLLIKSFQGFNSELQREHFCEKYMECDKFPNASFAGKIIEPVNFYENGTYEVRAKGDLDIHGKKQTRIIRVKIIVNNGALNIESDFVIPISDHDITIPEIVRQKIATEILVNFRASMKHQ